VTSQQLHKCITDAGRFSDLHRFFLLGTKKEQVSQSAVN